MHFHVQKGTFKLENASQPSYIVGVTMFLLMRILLIIHKVILVLKMI